MRLVFVLLFVFCVTTLHAQTPVVYYDSGKITINGIPVSNTTSKTNLENIVGSKARSGNLAYMNDPVTGEPTKQPIKHTHMFNDLGFTIGWFNKPPHYLECSFLLQKSIPYRKNKNDKRVEFPGNVFVGGFLFSKNLNIRDLFNEPKFKIVATGLGDPAHPHTLISYQNTILKCRFNKEGYLIDFSTHL
jgi:hypothetical protein